jgi:hypothetical protein
MGMRKIAVLLISVAGALTMGLIWTVGQTGLGDTNAHLCEFFSRYLPDIPENCQASDWIVSGSGYLFIFAVCIMVLDILWIFSSRSDKLPIAMAAAEQFSIQKAGAIEICFRPGAPRRTISGFIGWRVLRTTPR